MVSNLQKRLAMKKNMEQQNACNKNGSEFSASNVIDEYVEIIHKKKAGRKPKDVTRLAVTTTLSKECRDTISMIRGLRYKENLDKNDIIEEAIRLLALNYKDSSYGK